MRLHEGRTASRAKLIGKKRLTQLFLSITGSTFSIDLEEKNYGFLMLILKFEIVTLSSVRGI